MALRRSTRVKMEVPVLQKPGWDRSLERWLAFWEGKVADRPPVIIYIVPTEELDPGETPSLESTLARYDPAQNGPILDRAERNLAKRAKLEDDMPPALGAGGGVYFTGAVFGAPVHVTANIMTSDPIIEDWSQAAGIRYDPENVWVRRALGLARQLVARSGGRYAVTPGLLEGPSDICAELRGITRLGGDLYEYPDQVRRLARMGAEAWKKYARALYDIIPLYDGGTVTQWSLFVPGRGAAIQEDFCTIVSPRQYREFFAPLDRELARCADIAWIHVHAGQVHLVDELLRIDELRGIQIVNDGVASPPMSKMLPAMQRVQRSGKCLILRKYPPEDLDYILPRLSARGLAIDTFLPTVQAARQWLQRIEAWPFDSSL